MQKKQNTVLIKRCIDVCMTILLLCLMAYQVTGEQAHEWIGMGMTLLVIIHQVLNRKWYAAIFTGIYNAYRILTTTVNVLLLLSFALTAFCGMSMSGYAVPYSAGQYDREGANTFKSARQNGTAQRILDTWRLPIRDEWSDLLYEFYGEDEDE